MPGQPEPFPGRAVARQVRARGVTAPRVLRAIARFPRDRFMPPEARSQAEADCAVPIGLNQTISQPFIVGVMTAELALSGAEVVLEIGTGSGYQTAILSDLAREVFTVERHATLSLRARGVLDGLGVENVHYRIGDGTLGWAEFAPFDRVLVTAGAPAMPQGLFDQLAEGGVMVAPIGDEESQQMRVIRKRAGQPQVRDVLACRFVKLVGEDGWQEG